MAWILACFVALAGQLFAERAESQLGKWLTKPLASACFIGMALDRGALGSPYGQTVLAALVLCWVGDVLLIPTSRKAFLVGLISFLLGHVVFAVAFARLGVSVAWLLGAGVLLGVAAVVLGRWLWGHAERMRVPVLAYIAVITSMVALAAGAVGGRASPVLLVGATSFYLSDICVARNRFVTPGFDNRALGLPLYYAGQLLLAWTVGLLL